MAKCTISLVLLLVALHPARAGMWGRMRGMVNDVVRCYSSFPITYVSCQHLPFPAAYLFALLYFPPRFPVLASSFGIKFTDNSEAGTAGPESADVVEAGSDASDAALASTSSDAANAAAVFDTVRTAHLPLNMCMYNSFYFLRI